MLVRSIGLDLLSNVFVEMSESLVRHMFDTHDQLQLYSAVFLRRVELQTRPGEQSLVGCFVCFLDMLLARRS